jgi:cell division septation protein DedD
MTGAFMDKVELNQRRELVVDRPHLAFFFLGAVAVCAVFFALGYVVGRGQAYIAWTKEPSTAGNSAEFDSARSQKPPQDEILVGSKDVGSLAAKGEVKKKEEGTDYRRDLQFYNAVKDQKVSEDFHPQARKEVKQPTLPQKTSPGLAAVPGGSPQAKTDPSGKLVSLQLAALRSAREADRLTRKLRSKGYSVYLVSPGAGHGDQLIRVQVGPFSTNEEAVKVKARLERDGFKAITKR